MLTSLEKTQFWEQVAGLRVEDLRVRLVNFLKSLYLFFRPGARCAIGFADSCIQSLIVFGVSERVTYFGRLPFYVFVGLFVRSEGI